MVKSNSGIKSFIGAHIFGLFGVALLLSYAAFYLLHGSPGMGKLDKITIILGACLLISDLFPERIKSSLRSYPLMHTIDRFISKYGLLFLSFLIAIGFYLRFNNLGTLSFWVDEITTTYAAIGLLEQGTPVMPSGMPYTRSILNTGIIAFFFEIFGISEFSARSVSVIFGTLMIPLVYMMGAKVANKRVGLLAAVLITFSVWEIVWAREARMYAQFQFFYLLTAYLFFLGLDKNNHKALLFSAIAFVCAWYSHVLALTFLPVAFIYLLLCKREVLKIRYVISGILIGSGLALLYLFIMGKNPFEYIPASAPIWGQKPFYFYALTPDLRILFILVVIGIIISILLWGFGIFKNEKHSAYLYLNFFIPFIILSLNVWKAPRYAFYIFPFLVLAASYAIDLYLIRKVISEDVCREISNKIKIKEEYVRNFSFAILFIMVVLLLMQIAFSVTAFGISQKDHGTIHDGITHSNWKKGGDFLKNRFVEGDKIITTLPHAAVYYSRQADYYIKQIEHKGIINDEGQLVDRHTGAVILTTYDSFIRVVSKGRGWVIADYKIDRYYTDPRVRDYIRNNMTFHPEGSDDTIEVYSWNN
ncbi:4-amino-4-deoxy-L-arabinose transferase [Methanophagales archaeon]|nr:4-amino-4-deoxy-L-arabinose transferase [Methanophagales archaeon]